MADADQTVAAAVYSYNTIATTGAITANKNLTIPAATDAAGYTKIIDNRCTGAFGIVVKDSGVGTTVTVPNGTTAAVLMDSRGATLVSSKIIASDGSLAISAIPSTTGNIRVPSTTSIIASRNAANNADFVAMATDASDNLYLGAAADGTADYAQVIINPGSFGYLYLAGVPKLTWGADDMTISTINALQDGNADGKVIDVIRSVGTTNATVTNIYTWTIVNNAVTTIDILVNAITDDGAAGGVWKRSYTLRNDATVVTAIGTIHDAQTDEDAAGWDVTIDDDGAGTGRVRVTGAAATNITWYSSIRLQSVFA